jgi:hypothetical protein
LRFAARATKALLVNIWRLLTRRSALPAGGDDNRPPGCVQGAAVFNRRPKSNCERSERGLEKKDASRFSPGRLKTAAPWGPVLRGYRSLAQAAAFSVTLIGFGVAARSQTLPIGTRFVMSHFKANESGGDERLYLSHSTDGLIWTALNNGLPVWQPPGWQPFNNVVRDPTITFAHGFYWVAYTSGNYGSHDSFALVKSANLLDWTFVADVPARVPSATNQLTWNPVFFEEGDGSIHLFISISPRQLTPYNPIPEMRIHEMHPLNPEFTQWSAPVPVELPSTNNNEFWVWKEGDLYHGIYNDFTRPGTPIVHVTSRNLVTGWANPQVLGFHGQEGPMILPKPDGGYRLYAEGGNSALSPGYRTCDFDPAFSASTAQAPVTASVPMRNGKITAARQTLSFAQWETLRLAALPAERRGPLADADDDGLPNLVEHATDADPTAFTPLEARPQLFARIVNDQIHAGLRFTVFRPSSDATAFAETSRLPGIWSDAPADVLIESLTLLSDGTTRVSARTTEPVAVSGAILMRVAGELQPGPVPTPTRRIESRRTGKRPRR